MELRPYQHAAIDGLYRYFERATGNPLVVIPTGGGKSVVIAAFIKEALTAWPSTRVVMLTHVKELIAQNFQELIRYWQAAPAGIYSAGLNRRDLNAQILMASIQSVHKRAVAIQQCDLVLVDEAHLIPRNANTMYRRFLDMLGRINPAMKIIGFTATPYRLDSGRLDEGDDRIFTDIAYEIGVGWMIEQGYLAPVVPKRTELELDVSRVGTRGGEFVTGALERAVDTDPINAAAVDEIVARGEDRQSWLVFCAGVDHAYHIRDEIRRRGVSCETITGETPDGERDRLVRLFKAGAIRALTNANVLTTGFNAPAVDLIALLRPTQSTGLYVQMIGRGTRTATGKEACLVLDFAGNIERHGPIDRIDPRRPGSGVGDAPVKDCPSCQTIVYVGVRTCPACGHEFPEPKPELKAEASSAAVLSSQIEAAWIGVDDVSYDRHDKPGKPASLRVTYRCGLAFYREWVCLAHTGYARTKAVHWWRRRTGQVSAPTSIQAALLETDRLARPDAIQIRASGKFTEIVNYRFTPCSAQSVVAMPGGLAGTTSPPGAVPDGLSGSARPIARPSATGSAA